MEYAVEPDLTAEEFVAVLEASTLAERRPVDHPDVVVAMLAEADLIVTAREGDALVGVARSVTDFAYCCYLSDLAVDPAVQRRGVGRRLIAETRNRLGPECTLILLSAPAAVEYYPRLGFERHESCWILPPGRELS